MAKKLKPWKQLTIGEQNYYYYVYKGYSKMTNQYHMNQSYWKECEKTSEVISQLFKDKRIVDILVDLYKDRMYGLSTHMIWKGGRKEK